MSGIKRSLAVKLDMIFCFKETSVISFFYVKNFIMWELCFYKKNQNKLHQWSCRIIEADNEKAKIEMVY